MQGSRLCVVLVLVVVCVCGVVPPLQPIYEHTPPTTPAGPVPALAPIAASQISPAAQGGAPAAHPPPGAVPALAPVTSASQASPAVLTNQGAAPPPALAPVTDASQPVLKTELVSTATSVPVAAPPPAPAVIAPATNAVAADDASKNAKVTTAAAEENTHAAKIVALEQAPVDPVNLSNNGMPPPAPILSDMSVPGLSFDQALSNLPTTTLPSGLRIQAFVFNLKDQRDRRQSFLNSWKSAFPALQPVMVDGIFHNTRGKGILSTYVQTFRRLRLSYATSPSPPDFVLFFEDDARAFKEVSWPQDLDRVLRMLPPEASMVMLGGHDFGKTDKPNMSGISRISKAFGAYGWAVRRNAMGLYLDRWSSHLAEDRPSYACDAVWWDVWERHPAYVATPLLVDHKNGWSNTWKKQLDYTFVGRRDWWNLPRMPDSLLKLKLGL